MQLEVLNDRYEGFGFASVTVNETWAICGAWPQRESDYKAALRQGTYADLNLYYLSDLSGAEMSQYDQGITTIHEVGHWPGLFHTFEGN